MTTLITNSQFKQFDLNGEPLASGKIYTYEVGTTTPKTTYQDADATVAHTNPIILDSFGEATIYISGDTKFVVKDSDDLTIRTYANFADTSGTLESPVISSPDGAVYRSDATETGYIKIRLPMAEWPNTKLSLDVIIYQDSDDESIRIKASGYASSVAEAWSNVTAKTDGSADINVRFGNDGTYPAIYIGEVGSSWTRPQIAVINVFPGNYSYEPTDWDNEWSISITTSLGTISDTAIATSLADDIADNATDITTINNNLGWDSWQTETNWTYSGGATFTGTLEYRKSKDGSLLQILLDAQKTAGTGNDIYDFPTGYIPSKNQDFVGDKQLNHELFYTSNETLICAGALVVNDVIKINTIIALD